MQTEELATLTRLALTLLPKEACFASDGTIEPQTLRAFRCLISSICYSHFESTELIAACSASDFTPRNLGSYVLPDRDRTPVTVPFITFVTVSCMLADSVDTTSNVGCREILQEMDFLALQKRKRASDTNKVSSNTVAHDFFYWAERPDFFEIARECANFEQKLEDLYISIPDLRNFEELRPDATFFRSIQTEDYGFWHEWYLGYLNGHPLDWELQREVALIDGAIWDEGPESVSEKIKQIRARQYVESAFSDFKDCSKIRSTARHGIGGNNPPESIEDERLSGAITLIWEATEELSTALEEDRPARERIEAILGKFKSGLAGFLKWCAGKGDLAVDTLIKWGIPATGAGYAAKYPEKIEALIKAIENWLPLLS